MKVRDLIRDSVWMPGRDHGRAPPELSVLLPAYRRGADGLFTKAARSVLDQTFRSLELIIVDDASTDGTAEQIADLMKSDGRVSCIRHPQNIGLPAVSEYEAFVRSRGTYFGFAFDDVIFEPSAYSQLIEASRDHPDCVVHGYLAWPDREGHRHIWGKDDTPHEALRFANFIGNSSFVVHRAVLDEVGLYDPHVAASRVCDWDLWRRILRKHPLHRAPTLVGTEYGVSRRDSLGATYPIHEEAMQEYFSRPRNEMLRAENFGNYDVWNIAADMSCALQLHTLVARRHFSSRAWARDLPIASSSDRETLFNPRKKTLGIVAHIEASLSLTFDQIRDHQQPGVTFISPQRVGRTLGLWLARCDAVVIVRDLIGHRAAIDICSELNIPLFYFIDDNLIVCAAEDPACAPYDVDSMRTMLKGFDGVLCSTAPLAEYFRMSKLHPSVERLGHAIDDSLHAKLARLSGKPSSKALRIGFAGGEHRQKSFEEIVMPTLAKVSETTAIELFSARPIECPPADNISVHTMGFRVSFDEFLTTWRRLGIDILIHPPSNSANAKFKTANAVLVAHYLGALPIVAEEPGYDGLEEADGVFKGGESVDSWHRAILRVARRPDRAHRLRQLSEYCARAFLPSRNHAVLERLCLGHAVDIIEWADRVRILAAADRNENALSLFQAERTQLQAERAHWQVERNQWQAERNQWQSERNQWQAEGGASLQFEQSRSRLFKALLRAILTKGRRK